MCAFDIVIPSIGEHSLKPLLESISCSSVLPSQVFIVLRTGDRLEPKLSNYTFPIHILYSPIHGQVPQRQLGFRHSTSSIVCQLDADSLVPADFFQSFLKQFQVLESIYGPRVALAPAFIDTTGFLMFSSDSFFLRAFRSIYRLLGLLYPCGNLTLFGFNFPLNLEENKILSLTNTYNSDWLPGGCVLHRRANLITHNYYPYPGKAFAEDLFHSALLSKDNILLFSTYTTYIITEAHPRIDTISDALAAASIYYTMSKRFCRLTQSPLVFALFILLPYVKVILLHPLKNLFCS